MLRKLISCDCSQSERSCGCPLNSGHCSTGREKRCTQYLEVKLSVPDGWRDMGSEGERGVRDNSVSGLGSGAIPRGEGGWEDDELNF